MRSNMAGLALPVRTVLKLRLAASRDFSILSMASSSKIMAASSTAALVVVEEWCLLVMVGWESLLVVGIWEEKKRRVGGCCRIDERSGVQDVVFLG